MEQLSPGYACKLELADGEAIVLLKAADEGSVAGYEAETDGDVAVVRLNASGSVVDSFVTGGNDIAYKGKNLR